MRDETTTPLKRSIVRPAIVVAFAATVAGCSILTGLEGCKAYAAPSFSVTVRDAATQAPIAFGAQVSWTGPVSGSAEIHWVDPSGRPPDPGLDSMTIAGPFEAAGRFDVTVRKTGYRDWNGSVTVKQDGCHVKPASLVALLQRIV